MHPVLFTLSLGERVLPIGGYGVMLSLAVAFGCGLSLRAALRERMDPGAVVSALGLALGFGFAGGVLLHGGVQWLRSGSLASALAAPGLAFFGAAIGGTLGLWLGCLWGRIPLGRLLDASVPAFAFAHALGRVGCFLGGCCFGAPSELPFAVRYSDPLAPATAMAQTLHPVPLYEAVGLCVLALCFALLPARRLGSGLCAASYVLLYAVLRFVLEIFRGDSVRGLFLGVSTSQWVALLLGLVAVAFIVKRRPQAASPATALGIAAVMVVALLAVGRVSADALRELMPSLPSVVHIEGGWFSMGSDEDDIEYAVRLCRAESEGQPVCGVDHFAHEHPSRRVFLSRFAIDRSEVDNRSYRRCVLAGACPPARTADHDARLGEPRLPVAGVTWAEAQRYCNWVGGTLPTEAQWEYAARGASHRRFPWGRHYNSRVANHGPQETSAAELDGYRFAAPVDAFPDGRSANGLLNMAGNVWELVADRYDGRAYEDAERVDPEGPEKGEERVMRGGSWRSPAYELRVTQRAWLPVAESRPDVGFRCAYNVP